MWPEIVGGGRLKSREKAAWTVMSAGGNVCRRSCHCHAVSAFQNRDGCGRWRLSSEVSNSGGVPYAMLQVLKRQYAISFVRIAPSRRIHVSQSVAADWLVSEVSPSSLSSIASWLCSENASLRMALGPQSPTEKIRRSAWIDSTRD